MNRRLRWRVVSGYDVKGPACVLVETAGRRLLLDLGHGPDPGREPCLDGVGTVDALSLSHGHRDHAGALHRRREVGDPPVWCTPAVEAMLPPETPVRRLPLAGRCEVAGVRVRTGRNGHAPGGVWLQLDAGERRLLYCGDCSCESPVYALDAPPASDVVLLDASYGDYDTPLAEAAGALVEAIAGPGAAASGAAPALARADALLPVPPGGRGPEIAWWLVHRAGLPVERLQLGAPVRAAIAQLAARSDAQASLVPGVAPALAALAERAAPLADAPGVRLCAGADGRGAEAAEWLARLAPRDGVRIVFTGYLPAGTPARVLVDRGRALYRRWNVHPRRRDNAALVRATGATVAVPLFGPAAATGALAAEIAPATLARAPCGPW